MKFCRVCSRLYPADLDRCPECCWPDDAADVVSPTPTDSPNHPL